MIKQHGGYGFYSIENELMALSDKINALPVSIAKKYITYLKEVWSQEAPSELYSSLLTWCNRQLISSNIRHG